jgi:hypothetical protein
MREVCDEAKLVAFMIYLWHNRISVSAKAAKWREYVEATGACT